MKIILSVLSILVFSSFVAHSAEQLPDQSSLIITISTSEFDKDKDWQWGDMPAGYMTFKNPFTGENATSGFPIETFKGALSGTQHAELFFQKIEEFKKDPQSRVVAIGTAESLRPMMREVLKALAPYEKFDPRLFQVCAGETPVSNEVLLERWLQTQTGEKRSEDAAVCDMGHEDEQ